MSKQSWGAIKAGAEQQEVLLDLRKELAGEERLLEEDTEENVGRDHRKARIATLCRLIKREEERS